MKRRMKSLIYQNWPGSFSLNFKRTFPWFVKWFDVMQHFSSQMQLAGTKGWKSIGSYLAGSNPAEEKASLLSQSQSHQRLGYSGL